MGIIYADVHISKPIQYRLAVGYSTISKHGEVISKKSVTTMENDNIS